MTLHPRPSSPSFRSVTGSMARAHLHRHRVFNPATGAVQAEVALADDAVIADAIASAPRGYEVWSGYSIAKRRACCSRSASC